MGPKKASMSLQFGIRELKQGRRWRQQQRERQKGVDLAKQQLCTCSTLFQYIPFASSHDYDVKRPNFTFYGGREHKNSRKIHQHLTNWIKSDEVWNSADFLIKRRFWHRCCRRLCCFLNCFYWFGDKFYNVFNRNNFCRRCCLSFLCLASHVCFSCSFRLVFLGGR